MAMLSPEGTSKLPLPLRKPPRVAPHVLKAGAAGQRRARTGSGLRAWEPKAGRCPPYSDPAGGGSGGPSHLLRLQPRGREEKGVGARGGRAGRKSPSSPTHSAPCRELRAAGGRSSVTFHESEVQRSGGGVSSSRAGPAAPPRLQAPPLRAPPRSQAPPPSPRASQRPSLRAHPHAPPLPPGRGGTRHRRRDFRPPGSRKMAAAAGNPRLVFS